MIRRTFIVAAIAAAFPLPAAARAASTPPLTREAIQAIIRKLHPYRVDDASGMVDITMPVATYRIAFDYGRGGDYLAILLAHLERTRVVVDDCWTIDPR